MRSRSFGAVGLRHHPRFSSWRWGVGDSASSAFDISADETEKDPAERGSSSVPFTDVIRDRNDLPRWAGKAPHAMYAMNGGLDTKSERWDVDWWRMRLCGDPRMIRPRVPYGKVFQPGSMDGLWHGRILVSDDPVVFHPLVRLRVSLTAGIRSPQKPNCRHSWPIPNFPVKISMKRT